MNSCQDDEWRKQRHTDTTPMGCLITTFRRPGIADGMTSKVHIGNRKLYEAYDKRTSVRPDSLLSFT